MEPSEIRKLLLNPRHEVRVGAISIMDFQAREKKTSAERRRELYDLYMKNHDRIDSWSMVDRAAPYVVGGYLWDRSRQPLYELARSEHPMERRTAIVATYYLVRQNDLDDTSGSVGCWRTTRTIWFRRRSAAGSAKPGSETSADCGCTWTSSQPQCPARLCGMPLSTWIRLSGVTTWE